MKKFVCLVLVAIMAMSIFATSALASQESFSATLKTTSISTVRTSSKKTTNTNNKAMFKYSVTTGSSALTNLYRLMRSDGSSCTRELWAKPGTYTLGTGGTNIVKGYTYNLRMRANTDHSLAAYGSRASISVEGWLNVDP